MTELTDPALEFATLCRTLRPAADTKGAEHLAAMFNTDPHSHEFYQIIYTILDRANYLRLLISDIPEARHVASEINGNISGIVRAFQVSGLAGQWKTYGTPFLQENNVGPIMGISPLVRLKVSYPSLSEEEWASILQDTKKLIGWLEGQQLVEQDFIRQALINGLQLFVFRIERIKWLGWGCALQSLKDVIAAYMALERGYVDDGSMPIVGAMLKKVGDGLRTIYAKAGVAKDAVDRADFILRAYGAASLVAHAKAGGVVPLLTFGGYS